MTPAAKNLTLLILELGGKNPCIVHSLANLKVSARRPVVGQIEKSRNHCLHDGTLATHITVS